MKTRLSILVAALCSLAYFSYTERVAASDQSDSSRPSASARPAPSDFFDPMGLVSPSRHGELTTLGTGFSFTEGPAVDKHGNVFFTDQPNDRIYRWDAGTGQISLFLQGTGRANGMAFDSDGNLIACADLHGELWKIHPDGSHEVLANNYGGKLLNGPNDVWINPANWRDVHHGSDLSAGLLGRVPIRGNRRGNRPTRNRRRLAKVVTSTTSLPAAAHWCG